MAGPGSSPSESSVPAPIAWGSKRAWAVFVAVVLLSLVADLASKSIAFATIADDPVRISRTAVMNAAPGQLQALVPPHTPVVAVPHLLEFKLVLNKGAVFGMGQGKRVLFIVFTFLALGFAVFLFTRWEARDWMAHSALALIVSGGLGNLYDRIRFACVRDFLHPLPTAELPFGLAWPSGETAVWPYVSNVADAFLLIGIGVLLIKLWRADPDAAAQEESEAPRPSEDGS